MKSFKQNIHLQSLKYLIGFFVLVTATACSPKTADLRQNKYGYRSTVVYDSLDFVLDSFYFPADQVHHRMGSGYYTNMIYEGRDYLILSRFGGGGLDMYDLDEMRFVDSFHVSNDSMKCSTTWTTSFKDKERFYLLSNDGNLYLYHSGGRDSLINLDQLEGMAHNLMNVTTNIKSHNQIAFSGRFLFFPVEYRRKAPHDEQRLMARLDQQTGELIFTGIFRPGLFREVDYGVLRNNITHYVTDSCIYYAFEPIAEVWQYKFENDSVFKYPVRSKYQEEDTKPIWFERTPQTQSLLLDHVLLSPYYTRLIYDPYKKCFYRFHHHASNNSRPNVQSNDWEKRVSVMVLDAAMNTLGETILPEVCSFVYFAVPTKDGLIVNHGPIHEPVEKGIPMLKIKWNYKGQ